MALLQAHHCPPRNQQITAGVSYNLVNAKFTCSLCTVELPEIEFCEHLECHLTLKPYICKYCDRDFSTRGDICEHLGSFHQQDEQIFLLKLSGRTKPIIKKARNNGTAFYKPVNMLVPMSNSAEVVIIKTTTQNLTTVPGPKQKTMKAPIASYSRLSSLGPTSIVSSTFPTATSPVSLGAYLHLASQLNYNTVSTSTRPQLPAEQRSYLVAFTTQPQSGSLPIPSTNVLQTQSPSSLSQNVCTPALDSSLRLPFPQKLSRHVPGTQMASTLKCSLVNSVSASSVVAPDTHNVRNQLAPEKLHDSVTVTPLLAAETAAMSSVTNEKKPSPERIENSHDSFTITPLSAAESAVTNSVTQTEGLLLPESIRKSHDNATFTPSLANETVVVNSRTRTEKLSTGRIGMRGDYISLGSYPASDNRKTFSCSLLENSDNVAQFENNDMKCIIRMLKTSLAANIDINAVYHFACNMCRSEFVDLGQLELHLQESLLKVIECKHCASFFLNTFLWKKHMAVEHVGLPRMYCIKRKMLCYERKMHSNVPQQASQEDIPCLFNIERDAETTVSCSGGSELPRTSDYSSGSTDFYITSTALSLPVTRVSDLASTSAANFNLDMAETRTILCVSEQNKLEHTQSTCLPVEDIGADIDNRQESRHSSVVLKNNLRSGVQHEHDIEHGISNVVKDGGDQAASAAVNGKSISQTVFLSSHTSNVGGNRIQEHQQTDVLPSWNIHQADETSRTNSIVSVQSITDVSILSLQLENRQKPTERSVVQQTLRENFENAHDSETNIHDLLREPYINNRNHCTPDVSSVLKTVSHDSGDIANPATNSLGPDHDSCHDIDFSSSKDPACTLQESVGDFAGNDDILENDMSCGHDLLYLNIDKRSSNLTQDIQADNQETKKDGSYDKIHYNKNSLVSTKDGQLYASNETSACIESRETREENLLNSPSQSDIFMEEINNTSSVDQTSIASNITENKDSSHTETNGLSDKVSTEQDLSNSLFRCNCGTVISCITDDDHNVQPQDKSLKIYFNDKCAKCRLVTEESSHPDNTSEEYVNSITVDAVPSKDSRSLSEKATDNFLRTLKRRASLILENSGKISRLEHVCGNHITRSKVDLQESSTIKPDVLSGQSETCVGPEISKTNPALKSDLETAVDNGSTVLSESKNTARDFTTSNREMLDAHCKRKSEAGQGEGVITSKLLRINSKQHSKPEHTIKKLERALSVSQSPKDIQGADVPVPDSDRFRCSACPFVISQSYTELKQHVKFRHPQDKSARVCRIRSRSLQNATEQSERWQDATLSLQEVQNNDMTMSSVHDGVTVPQHAGINSETSIEYRASVNKSEVNSESSHKIHKKQDIGIYKCIRPKCTFTRKWNLEKMKAHIKSKHPYYSCGYCKAPYTTLPCLYKHSKLLHRDKKPRVMDDTIALDLLFKRVDIPYNGQSAECTDVTLQTPAKRKKQNQSSLKYDVKKSEAKANSELKVLKTKRHTPLKSCDVSVTRNKQNQPLGDSKVGRTSKDNEDGHLAAARGLKTPQCKLVRSKSESIVKEISPVPEHEVSFANTSTVTSKTAAISNNGDSRSVKTERHLFKTTMSSDIPQFDHAAFLDSQASSSKVTSTVTEESDRKADKSASDKIMSSKFAKVFDHTHNMPPTVSLHAKKTVAPNATSLLSLRSAENNPNGNKVTEYHESEWNSSTQNVCYKMRPLRLVSSQNTVRKGNSPAATSNHIDINVSLNSATSVQSSSNIEKQELNSIDISDKQESSNRHGDVHETFPDRLCSETASTCVSDPMLLHHTTATASAIVISKTQGKKLCGTWTASQLEANTAAECDENQDFVAHKFRIAHSGNNLSMPSGSTTESKFENAPTTDMMPDMMSLSQHDYPFRCTACSRILKCVRDIEKHYNNDHPRQDVRLTERKSGFVYSNSGKCLSWKDGLNAPTDSYLCSNCAFRSMKRSDVEGHIRRAHPKTEVRMFSLCKPNTD